MEHKNVSSADKAHKRADTALEKVSSEREDAQSRLDYLLREANKNNFARNFLAMIMEGR